MTAPPPSPAPVRRTNVLAILSVCFGAASWVMLPFIGAVVAIITGHIARSQIRETGEEGDAMAVIGLVLGWLHVAVTVLAVGVVVSLFMLGMGAAIWGSHSRIHP